LHGFLHRLHCLHPVQVSEFAAAKRVVLKGDLPIGVDKRSVDTWMEVRMLVGIALRVCGACSSMCRAAAGAWLLARTHMALS
jgi:hypothetical protein